MHSLGGQRKGLTPNELDHLLHFKHLALEKKTKQFRKITSNQTNQVPTHTGRPTGGPVEGPELCSYFAGIARLFA